MRRDAELHLARCPSAVGWWEDKWRGNRERTRDEADGKSLRTKKSIGNPQPRKTHGPPHMAVERDAARLKDETGGPGLMERKTRRQDIRRQVVQDRRQLA